MTTKNGKKLNWQSRQMIYKLHSYFKERKRDPTTEEYQVDVNLSHVTAEATGLSWRTVVRIVAEGKSLLNVDGQTSFETTEQRRKTVPKKRIPMDCFIEGLVRRRVLQASIESKTPVSLNVIHKIMKTEDIIQSSHEYLRNLLIKIGFRHMTKKRILFENQDITAHRWTFINNMKKYRDEGRNIVYIDETYFSLVKGKLTNWETDDENLGVLYYSGKGQGLIVLHAGGRDGFLKHALRLIKTISVRDCDMNYDVFSKWVKEDLLPQLPNKSVIVMDNAEYHSSNVDKIPTEAWTKNEIRTWLQQHNIAFDNNLGKSGLLSFVKKAENVQEIDKLLSDNGHEVLRFPLWHQELNPLELVWRDLKQSNYLGDDLFCHLGDMQTTLTELMSNYPIERWESCIEYVEKIESEYFVFNNVFEDFLKGLPADEENNSGCEGTSHMDV